LHTHGVTLRPTDLDWILRPVERSRSPALRPLAIVLQPRQVYEVLADALDAQWPCGLSIVLIGGARQSGLRTTRLIAARLARLRGYVPIDAELLERAPPFSALVGDRHVCVLADERSGTSDAARALLTRLAVERPRRHVVLAFT